MNRMTVTIRFLGAAGTVTGSKYLVEHDGQSLLVDCGLFQGYKQLRLRNREPLPVLPNRIGAVLLTHAHLDHTGYLPLLCKEGFHGKVWSTPATSDLARIMLPASGHIQAAAADFDLTRLVDWMLRWTWDLCATVLGGQARYFPDCQAQFDRCSAGADRAVMLDCYNALVQIRRVVKHPLNPRLLIEDMLLRYARAVSRPGGRS